MWHNVSQQISETLHIPFEIHSKVQIQSNEPNQLYRIANNEHAFYVKVAPLTHLERFEVEMLSRARLIRDSDFLTPDVITVGANLEFCFLVTECVSTQETPVPWDIFAHTLAKLHSLNEQEMFGLEEDNFVEHLVQPNQWHKKWAVFFAEDRIAWQLQLLHEQGFSVVPIDSLVELVKPYLCHHPEPALLHGNLKPENIAVSENNKVILTNPACYYGDSEVDLAFLSFYHNTLPDEFISEYFEIMPMLPGFNDRQQIYQLYPMLIEANKHKGKAIERLKNHTDLLFDLLK